jgi:hypothetical protein
MLIRFLDHGRQFVSASGSQRMSIFKWVCSVYGLCGRVLAAPQNLTRSWTFESSAVMLSV